MTNEKTPDWGWRVRITVPGNTGSGIVVDDSHVLTCAHVVAGQDRARVVFDDDLVGVEASVEWLSQWSSIGDPGDIAVLRLKKKTLVTPAVFASPDILRRRRVEPGAEIRLGAFGFPVKKEISGSVVTLTTRPDLDLRGEWWRVDVADAVETIKQGFSGAGVYDLDTGEVLGMLSDADLQIDRRSGRMLPLHTLRRYWEPLDDHLPYAWLDPDDRRELRELLGMSTYPVESLTKAFEAAFFPARPRRAFRSLWDAVSYAAEEMGGRPAIARLLDRLEADLDEECRRLLTAWIERRLPEAKALRRPRHRSLNSLVIRVDRYPHELTLTMESITDGEMLFKAGPLPVKDAADLKEQVRRLVPDARRALQRRDAVIEFVVPVGFFNQDYETWILDEEQQIRMGIFPLVVRDVYRTDPTSYRYHFTQARWETLRDRRDIRPEPIGCTFDYSPDDVLNWLRDEDDICVVTFSSQPTDERINAVLNAGIPVMLWPRRFCPSPPHDLCDGDLHRLNEAIMKTHPDGLPERVQKIRAEARNPRKREGHFGRNLTLVWDDPARTTPDPSCRMEVG